MNPFPQELAAIEGAEIRTDVPMREHTSFRIGGCADFLVTAHSSEAAASVLRLCRREKVPCFLTGRGTNLLVSDAGVRGVVLCLAPQLMQESVISEDGLVRVTLSSGAGLGRLVSLMERSGALGFARLAGIPGSVGGAIAMNAGTRLGSVSELIGKIVVLSEEGLAEVSAADAGFGYRSCRLASEGTLIVGAVFQAVRGSDEALESEKTALREAQEKRRHTQPDQPSAGCIFRNPEGRAAGALIDACGLKGRRAGDALVSPVHANFIVNSGRASSGEVLRLMREIQEAVAREAGLCLEPEVRLLGEFQHSELPEGARVVADLADTQRNR